MFHLRTAMLAAMFFATPAQAEMRVYEGPATTHIENVGELTRSQQAGLEKFAGGKPYFGAIFIEEGGNGWGSFTGAHRLKDAFDMALRICERFADKGHCTLAGVTVPEDFNPASIPTYSLSARAAEKHAIYLSRTDGYRAFAVSGTSSFGWATQKDSAAQAVEAALGYCHSSALTKLLLLDVDLRAQAIKDDLYSCRIIDQSGPPS